MKRILISIFILLLSVTTVFAADSEQDYYPKNLYTFGTNGKLVISWLNPYASDLKTVKIYEIADGEEFLLDDVSQEAGGAVSFKLDGRTLGSVYTFRIDCSFTGHKATSFDFAVEYNEDAMPTISSWGREINTDKLGYCPILTYVDVNDTHSGTAALRIIGNTTAPGNNFLSYTQKLALDSEKKYQLSFWAKGNLGMIACYNNWAQFDGNSSFWRFNNTGEMKDWEQRTITLTKPQNNLLRLIIEQKSDYFLIDDFEMYELDEEGLPTGDNLIANGSFETGYSESSVPEGIDAVKVNTETYELASLSWKPISNTSQKINIYRKFGDEYVKIAVLPGSYTGFDVKGLMTDEENPMAISVTGTNYIESELYEFSAMPKSLPLTISDIRLYRSSTDISELVRGTLNIETEIKNNRMGDGFTAEIVAALYRDGELTKVWAGGTQEIPETPSSGDAETVSMRISIPRLDDGDYHLEVFLWDNYETMKVLKSMVSIREATE